MVYLFEIFELAQTHAETDQRMIAGVNMIDSLVDHLSAFFVSAVPLLQRHEAGGLSVM